MSTDHTIKTLRRKIIATTISFAESTDRFISRVYLSRFSEKNALITFLFHALFRDEEEIHQDLVHPQQGITVKHFRQFIEYYLGHGYTFVSPDDILKGLELDRKYVLITFDDGYFNNQKALPILNEYRIPAVFFISTDHVESNKCFWWDVLYRETVKSGNGLDDLPDEMNRLRSKPTEEIEKYLGETFGADAFRPVCDIDRPFTPDELRHFSKEQYVFVGNHTSNHAILTNYSRAGIRSQLQNAQNAIKKIIGITPQIISYPNGNYSPEVIRIARDVGLKLGITVEFRKNYLPLALQRDACMRLGRFTLVGNNDLIKQCEIIQSDFSCSNVIKNFLTGRYR